MPPKAGDAVYRIGTVHTNIDNKGVVVEVAAGVLAKDGTAKLHGLQNAVLPYEGAVKAAVDALHQAVASALHGKMHDNETLSEVYVPPPAPPPAPKADAKTDTKADKK